MRNPTRTALLLLCTMLTLNAAHAFPPPVAESDETVVRRVLGDQVAAWNKRDLEGYMRGYWNSPELRFYASGTIAAGWQETLDRYRRRYQGEGKEMGTLEMRDVEVKLLSDKHAFVRGRWHLAFTAGASKEAEGLFTLLLQRFPDGWKIIHDHSSSK